MNTALKRRQIYFGAAAVVAAACIMGGASIAAQGAAQDRQQEEAVQFDLEDGVLDGKYYGAPVERLQAQGVLNEAIEPLLALVDPTEGARRESADGEYYGYASVVIDSEAMSIDVYWVGPVQEKAQAILDAIPADINLGVHSVDYTSFELADAADALLAHSIASGFDGFELLGVGTDEVQSGLTLSYKGDAAPEAVVGAASNVTDVRILSAEMGEELISADARWTDAAAYNGGAGYYTPNNGASAPSKLCSTGFGVTSDTGAKYLVTARHCWLAYSGTESADNDATTGWGEWKSLSTRNWPEWDYTLIKPYTQSISKNAFAGSSYNTTSEITLTGSGGNSVGNILCTSGANSGTRCNVEVYDNYDPQVFHGTTVAFVSGYRWGSSGYTFAQGDSGGLLYLASGSTTRNAAGMISAFASPGSACTPSSDFKSAAGALCATTEKLLWSPAKSWAEDTGFTILTD